jgi:hypothetical protein
VLPVAQVLGSPTGSDSSAGFAGGIGLGLLITAGALGVSFLIPRPAAAELGGRPDPADTAAPLRRPTRTRVSRSGENVLGPARRITTGIAGPNIRDYRRTAVPGSRERTSHPCRLRNE